MRYEILGPLRLVGADGCSSISARKVATVLALLLIRADQIVSPDALMAEIWADRPPRRALAGVHVYISQLRKLLRHPDRPDGPVITQPSGYVLRLGQDDLDSQVFAREVARGRELLRARRHEEAAGCFERGLSLWRGPALGDVRGPVIDPFAAWLAEDRLECLELLIDARLQLGGHRELVGRLYSLTVENPLREVFYHQLMLALYRSGRQAEALEVYQGARRTFVTELGLEPRRSLRELQRAILVGDGRLELVAAS